MGPQSALQKWNRWRGPLRTIRIEAIADLSITVQPPFPSSFLPLSHAVDPRLLVACRSFAQFDRIPGYAQCRSGCFHQHIAQWGCQSPFIRAIRSGSPWSAIALLETQNSEHDSCSKVSAIALSRLRCIGNTSCRNRAAGGNGSWVTDMMFPRVGAPGSSLT